MTEHRSLYRIQSLLPCEADRDGSHQQAEKVNAGTIFMKRKNVNEKCLENPHRSSQL